MFFFKMSVTEAIESLKRASSFGLGSQPSQPDMLKLLEKVEKQHPASKSPELEYWLGIAWRNYTAWFVRGDERKPYLEKAITHFDKAYKMETESKGTNWITYASELGKLLIDEAIVRDLDRGIFLLGQVYDNTTDYEPELCSYADALYKANRFQEAADVAISLNKRASKSQRWRDSIPPAPMAIAARAYRAQVKQYKKENQLKKAIMASTRLLETGCATDNDKRVHAQLIE